MPMREQTQLVLFILFGNDDEGMRSAIEWIVCETERKRENER